MKILAVLTGILLILLPVSCGWHIFPYEENNEEFIHEDHLIDSLDEIAGTWRSGNKLVLTYTEGESLAYLSVDGVDNIPADLEDLTGRRVYIEGEFRLFVPDLKEGEKVMVCKRGSAIIVGFIDLATARQRTYKLSIIKVKKP